MPLEVDIQGIPESFVGRSILVSVYDRGSPLNNNSCSLIGITDLSSLFATPLPYESAYQLDSGGYTVDVFLLESSDGSWSETNLGFTATFNGPYLNSQGNALPILAMFQLPNVAPIPPSSMELQWQTDRLNCSALVPLTVTLTGIPAQFQGQTAMVEVGFEAGNDSTCNSATIATNGTALVPSGQPLLAAGPVSLDLWLEDSTNNYEPSDLEFAGTVTVSGTTAVGLSFDLADPQVLLPQPSANGPNDWPNGNCQG